MNDSWGYAENDCNWKTPYDVITLLLRGAAQGGNLLINVGPDEAGNIPEASQQILSEVGKWLDKNRETLLTDTRSPFSWSNSVNNVCVRGNTVYLPLKFEASDICWAELKNKVLQVRQLDTGKELKFEQVENRLFIHGIECSMPWTVVAVEVEGSPEPATDQTTFWIPN